MKPSVLLSLILALICLSGCAANQRKNVADSARKGQAARNLGEAFMGEGNYRAALREFIKARNLNPDDPYLHNDMGLSYLAMKRPDKAVTHFKKALALNPSFAAAKNNLGTAYLAQENWDAAIATFKELSENLLYATPHYPLTNMGWAYFNKGAYSEARAYYEKALKAKPNYPIAMRGLGRTHLKMGNHQKAIEILKETVQVAPRFMQAHLDLARAYRLSNERENALNIYRRVMEMAPKSEAAEQAQKEAGLMLLQRRRQ